MLPLLITAPSAPPSILVPPKALSNLWTGKNERTPSLRNWSRPALIWPGLQEGTSLYSLQSNSDEVSIPITTASLPWLTTLRACHGSVTTRRKPLPGPPYWASM